MKNPGFGSANIVVSDDGRPAQVFKIESSTWPTQYGARKTNKKKDPSYVAAHEHKTNGASAALWH
jgi:hypothetical protein